MKKIKTEPLWTSGFILACAANFLMFFSFYLLLPTLPFYLLERFNCSAADIGLILSSYTIAALMIRPFSGYLVDMLARKPLYIFSQFIFTGVFIGYPLAATITMFVVFRIFHGLAFGTSSVSGSTLVIDILPSSRRGEGLGYYGLSNNLAMAFGPMVGLFLHDYTDFNIIFSAALICSISAIITTSFIKAPPKPVVVREPVSLDRFILLRGIPAGISLLLLSIPYGMTTSYVALYGKEFGITNGSGIFFSSMAVGLMVSRLISGRMVDKGLITKVITIGMCMAGAAFLLLGSEVCISHYSMLFSEILYYIIAFILGFGFGTMFPAFNTLFINLAPHNKRGTASSTYLTSWDVGIGIGLMLGGQIREITHSYSYTYLLGSLLSLIALIYFVGYVTPHFNKYKLR